MGRTTTLIIHRHVEETVILGDVITIRVGRIELENGKTPRVTLHIMAPREVIIDRGECHKQRKAARDLESR